MKTDEAIDDEPVVDLLLENDVFRKNVNLEKLKLLKNCETKEKSIKLVKNSSRKSNLKPRENLFHRLALRLFSHRTHSHDNLVLRLIFRVILNGEKRKLQANRRRGDKLSQ